MSEKLFKELLSNIDAELEKVELLELKDLERGTSLPGLGVYLLFYTGNSHIYKASLEEPIYVGKAIASGASTGKVLVTTSLKSRLLEHKSSITIAENLNIEDFKYKYLAISSDVGAHFIPGIESYLIRKYVPLWNSVISGFGNHDPGKGRHGQSPSKWDILHPGRKWVSNLTGVKLEEIHLHDIIAIHYKEREVTDIDI